MKINKFALLAGFGVALTLFLAVAAHADEADQATKVTFSQPIAIPGQVLPAGSYLFKVGTDDLNIVRIYNADGTRLYATIATIATDRRQPTGHTVLVLAEQSAGNPEALRKWFYPGDTTGHEFVYSNQQEQQIAQDRQQMVVVKGTAEAGD
jgi:hypothetical protein